VFKTLTATIGSDWLNSHPQNGMIFETKKTKKNYKIIYKR